MRCCDVARTYAGARPGCYGSNYKIFHGRLDLQPALVCAKHLFIFEATPQRAFDGQRLRDQAKEGTL